MCLVLNRVVRILFLIHPSESQFPINPCESVKEWEVHSLSYVLIYSHVIFKEGCGLFFPKELLSENLIILSLKSLNILIILRWLMLKEHRNPYLKIYSFGTQCLINFVEKLRVKDEKEIYRLFFPLIVYIPLSFFSDFWIQWAVLIRSAPGLSDFA